MEKDQYVVESCDIGDLSASERTRCLRLIADGGAVTMTTARRDFPRSAMIAVARMVGEVVGIASIKPIREDYAAGTAKKAKFPFDPRTPELGYVDVDPRHRGKRLSSRMSAALAKNGAELFATTSNPKMKSALKSAGFVQRGVGWKGRRGDKISLWIRS
jgi:GNAT superfamily N-acetyltransferase